MSTASEPVLPAELGPPAELLDTLLTMSLTAVAVLKPLFDADQIHIRDFAWVYLNPAGQRMLQQPEQPPLSLLSLFPTAQQDGVFAKCCAAYKTGEQQRHQTNYQADGLDGYFLLVAQRHENLLVVNFTDTNEQPRTPVEQMLRESQARERQARAEAEQERSLLQALLAQAPVALALFQGEELRITAANEQMATMWGRTPEQVFARPLLEAVPELQGQGFDHMLQHVRETKVPVTGTETPATLLRDGRLQTTYYNFVYQPLVDAQGTVLGVIDVAVDVSEQVRARQALQELNQQLEARVEQRTRQLAQLNEGLEARVERRTRELEAARAEAERQRGELQRVFEQAPAAIAVYRGPHYVIELANATVARLWGRTQEQLLGKGLFEALPEVAGMGYEQLLDHVMATGEPHIAHAMEAQHDRNGRRETVYWDFVYVPMYAEDGIINGAMVVANEVTAQVLARRQLEQLNQELEARVQQRTQEVWQQSQRLLRLVEQAPAAIALLNGPNFVFELLNASYQALFPERELLGRSMLDAVPELRQTPLVGILQDVYRTGISFEGREYPIPFMGPDGREHNRYFDFVYQARYDAAGTIDGIVVFGFDVTASVVSRQQVQKLNDALAAVNQELLRSNQELTEVNAQLTRVNVDLDTFIYTASHDLRAPVLNIEGLVAALRQELFDEPVAKADVEYMLSLIDQAVKRFQTTISHLTNIVRLEQRTGEGRQPIELAALVEDVRLDLAPLLANGPVELLIDVATCPVVRGTPKDIRSILFNLLSNAIKYRAPDRPARVRLTATCDAQWVELRVEDNGLGLSGSQQKKLFGLFTRLHDHVEGSGVGLYSIKRLIENQGGTIQVESTLGVGTTFRVRLPL
ncbi:PAS domain-containing sensor histidine kinase [Hymenobacter pini]|uniref:PAS domain-containing sensor histidine kinase n=1 Tax=Hymenobacter pini TaxID=2880879 RepID=UPI001CF16BAA|nr:PAS domain-containing protein [Hymenobacter pini]MCA8830475.1 PAS domain-containing protein [Hymenobacter pini]